MNNNDQVAFITRTSTSATTRRIVVSDGTTTTMFPTVSAGAGFTSIDSFAPPSTTTALVAFRGTTTRQHREIRSFVTDGATFQRIAGVNDTLMTDTGPRVVGFLMGGVRINNRGSVTFGVQFTAASGGGNAIYVAYQSGAPTRQRPRQRQRQQLLRQPHLRLRNTYTKRNADSYTDGNPNSYTDNYTDRDPDSYSTATPSATPTSSLADAESHCRTHPSADSESDARRADG